MLDMIIAVKENTKLGFRISYCLSRNGITYEPYYTITCPFCGTTEIDIETADTREMREYVTELNSCECKAWLQKVLGID